MACLLFSCSEEALPDTASVSLIDSLFEADEIFKAIRCFEDREEKLPEVDRLRLHATVEFYKNHPIASNESIEKLLQVHANWIDDSTRCDMKLMQQLNSMRMFQYAEAADAGEELLGTSASCLDSEERASLENTSSVWEGLRDIAPQKIRSKAYTDLQLVDGYKVPAQLNAKGSTVDLLFDTGANLSVLIESVADSMGLDYVDAHCMVNSVIGDKVPARIAVARSLQFGEIIVQNVVFLVFPDSALYVPQADLQIYGIIGFPVMSALGEIHLTRDKRIIIPELATARVYSNLAFDFLTPVIEVSSQGDSLPMTFDLGAGETWLYASYFDRYRDRIETQYPVVSRRLGGAGGSRMFDLREIPFTLEVGTDTLTLPTVKVLPTPIQDEEDYYGNLGQDVISSYDKVIINFDAMFVKFAND